MQTDAIYLLWAFSSGLTAGLFFFGGLWLTVRELPRSRHPALLSLSSFIARTTVSLLVFYYSSGSHWKGLLACLTGFVLMRLVLVRLLQPAFGGTDPERR
ncbi:MAG: ATP synthase subunit I [Syntrophobacteraceae bacterium]